MANGENPLLDDDDEEYPGQLSGSSLPEELPSEILPELPSSLPHNEPISDESELPDLSAMLGEIDLGTDRLDSGSLDGNFSTDAFDMEENFPSRIREEFASEPLDDEEEDDSPFSSSRDPLADILNSLDLDDDVPEPAGRSSLDDYGTLRPGSFRDEDDDFSVRQLDLDGVIAEAIERGASDIHLTPGDEVVFRVVGEIVRVPQFGLLDDDMMLTLEQKILSHVLEQEFVEEQELDTGYVVGSGKHRGRRLRLSVGRAGGGVTMNFRIIADRMPTPEELEIPKAMRDWVKLPSGLILVNGPTGSGKSTTLSSLVQEIQFQRAEKVISIEKPVEFIYAKKPNQRAAITQREVGRDTRSFAAALTSAMRQDPDIILVGEVRDRSEIDQLPRAAETGHLAISTMHTTSCAGTIGRIISMYEGDEQRRVLATLAEQLRGMMTQALVMTPDKRSRFAVREVLQVDKELRGLILEANSLGIRDYQEKRGITMEHELVKAVRAGKASAESARAKAPDPLYFDELYDA